ncbi:MAG TPA: hypothetical protein VKA46_32960 [Gemmataceae bacterium]|nr:hypothetical protein [Gemmataceae bacterium]
MTHPHGLRNGNGRQSMMPRCGGRDNYKKPADKHCHFFTANVIAGVALILLISDPARDLRPVLALVAVAVLMAWVLPRFVRPKS